MFTCELLLSYWYPNLSEGADRVAGQLRGGKEYPFSGVTKSGRVWRKVPESDARSVPPAMGPDTIGFCQPPDALFELPGHPTDMGIATPSCGRPSGALYE